MNPNFPYQIILMLLILFQFSCTPRQDMAPVISDEQRNNQYHLPTTIQGQELGENHQNVPASKQRDAISIQNTGKNNSEPLTDKRSKNKSEPGPSRSKPNYHKVEEGETLYSLGVRTGFGYEQLASWNNIAPPYEITEGQTIKLFSPEVEKQDEPVINETKQLLGDSNNNKNNNPAAPDSTLTTTKQPHGSKTSPLEHRANKNKKSIASIVNKKKLMLNFIWPLQGKIKKQFSQTNNKGIDISGSAGQSVRASEAGKVAYCGQGLIGFGNLLIIKHNSLYLSAYANNGDLFVKEGQHVHKGQKIAKLGLAVPKKAFLHFEIRKNGKPIDPLSLLPNY